ncbi:50S ribosomal protein L17, partial [bacterium]|nr:50S ribosomal protein L17 [candidate division CSSED10-310 bacterium]
MRHRKLQGKLNRTSSHRTAMLRNMATSLLDREQIVTTAAKAKAVRGFAERIITLAKQGNLHARRLVLRDIRDKEVVKKLFSELADRYAS